jgi:hypothetical protein
MISKKHFRTMNNMKNTKKQKMLNKIFMLMNNFLNTLNKSILKTVIILKKIIWI